VTAPGTTQEGNGKRGTRGGVIAKVAPSQAKKKSMGGGNRDERLPFAVSRRGRRKNQKGGKGS